MKCFCLDENQKETPMIMGCYGLGIGRTVAAAIEQGHDEKGILWPVPLAPFEVTVMSLNPNDPQVTDVSNKIYRELSSSGVDVLYDDREERAGFKFKDNELIGIPYQVIVGSKGVAKGVVELGFRKTGEKKEVVIDEVVSEIHHLISD